MLISLFRSFQNIIVFDVETTGTNPKLDEIIEIAVLRIAREQNTPIVKNEYSTLIKLTDGRKLAPIITDLTGLTEKQLLTEGISKESACIKIADILNCYTPLIVAYNAQFDLGFLYRFLNQYNKAGVLKNVKMLDVLTIYKDRRPYPHKLTDAAQAYSLDKKNSHRAYGDAQMTYDILCEMWKEHDDLERYVNLFGYNPKYGVSGAKISSVKYLAQGYNSMRKLYDI